MTNAPVSSKPVVIFGVGDFSRSACVLLEEEGGRTVEAFTVHEAYLPEGDDPQLLGRPVVAFERVVEAYPPATYEMLVTVGYGGVNKVRAEMCAQARAAGYTLLTHVSPFAKVAGNVEFGDVGSSRVDLQACKLEYSIVSPK